ncbi:hypothetical protein HJG60_011846 [Phyllostomus discolor]|uniref:Uncharacterized protein n=1 Tax=Phyllostomus discolor TaxID=89673 RepID=A0A833ZKU8_9CHIR|nr:hypothetical protein HJG60_011846 [Phyllostomus discolor]
MGPYIHRGQEPEPPRWRHAGWPGPGTFLGVCPHWHVESVTTEPHDGELPAMRTAGPCASDSLEHNIEQKKADTQKSTRGVAGSSRRQGRGSLRGQGSGERLAPRSEGEVSTGSPGAREGPRFDLGAGSAGLPRLCQSIQLHSLIYTVFCVHI